MSKIKWAGIAICLLLGSSVAAAQVLLPNGQQQFVDANGTPLAGGSVYFYTPGTTAAKTTWVDQGETTPNTNPVILNSAGRAIIWGTGLYREVVYDQNGNLVWDQITGENTSSGPSGGAPLGGFGAQASLASAATTSLGSVASHNVLITGTTAITSFGSAATTDAPIYLVQFADSLTLTYNATSMVLPGAANIQTSAGDVALVEYAGGGNWQVVEYYRANGSALTPPVQHTQVFSANGTFTTPAGTGVNTQFEFTVTGGGGAGCATSAGDGSAGTGGGAGTGIQDVSGLAAGSNVTVVVGAGAAAETGSTGNSSSITVGATTYTATGGTGSVLSGDCSAGSGGTATGFSQNFPGGTGTAVSTGEPTLIPGSTIYGTGGPGAGGGSSATGPVGNGKNGIVIVKWIQ